MTPQDYALDFALCVSEWKIKLGNLEEGLRFIYGERENIGVSPRKLCRVEREREQSTRKWSHPEISVRKNLGSLHVICSG